MRKLMQFAGVCLFFPMLLACSKGPTDAEVESLIEAQYDQAQVAIDETMSKVGANDSEMGQAVGNIISSMVPKLESIDNIECGAIEDSDTFQCSANVTQSIAGNNREEKSEFRVYKVNDEWVMAEL